MKKCWGLTAVLLTGLSFSSLSYGFGMQCTAPAALSLVFPGVETQFTFDCTNTGPVAYGSFGVTPTALTAKTTSVDSVVCPNNSDIAVNDTCVVTATFSSATKGNYVVNFNDQYGGDTNLNILGSSGLLVTVANYVFTNTNSPAGGATQILQASGSQGALYAVNQGQLYKNDSGVWTLQALPATVDELTNNLVISQIISDSNGNIYAVMADNESIWEYNASTTVWTDTQTTNQIKNLHKIGVTRSHQFSSQFSKFKIQYPTGASVGVLAADTRGNLYVIVNSDDVWRYSGTTGIWTDTHADDLTDSAFAFMKADNSGNVYLGTSDPAVFKYNVNQGWVNTHVADAIPDNLFISDACTDAYGNLYVFFLKLSPFQINVWKYNPTATWVDTGAALTGETSIVADSNGVVYAADGLNRVWKYTGSDSWVNTNMPSTATGNAGVMLTADSEGNIYAQSTKTSYVFNIWKYNVNSGWLDTTASTQTILATLLSFPGSYTFPYVAVLDHSDNFYVASSLDMWKYPGTGTTWTEVNEGLPLGGVATITPTSNTLFSITSAGIQEYSGSNTWVTSLSYGSQQFIKALYAGGSNVIYADVPLNARDTAEDVLALTSGQWLSTHFPSEANNGLLVVGAAALNGVLYVLTVNDSQLYNVWMYQNGLWSNTLFSQVSAQFNEVPPTFHVVFDQFGNVYVVVTQAENVNHLYQGKDNHGTWTWTMLDDESISIPGIELISDGGNNIYIVAQDGSSHDEIMQYHASGSAATTISNPVTASTLSHLVTDSHGNLYVATRTGTNEANYQYDVWEYTVAASSPAWVDTGLAVTSKNASIFNLYVQDGYLYASTQSGVYVYSVIARIWLQVDSQASMSLNFGSTLLYDLTQSAGVYKALPSSS